MDLRNFIEFLFNELTEETKECSILIRSESSIREDLKRWGVNFGSSKSIYFEGHERPDVVADREQYVEFFSNFKKMVCERLQNHSLAKEGEKA